MRFNSIKIKNYRQYENIFFEFEKNKKNDIHIIIASNGVGKTNILNAINWCLYGDEPHTSGVDSNTNEDKLPLGNLKAIYEAKEQGKDICEVSVEIVASEGEEIFKIIRSAEINVFTNFQKGKDRFEVIKKDNTGKTEFLNEEKSNDIINQFLPRKIREYFYFDGEKLLNYFDNKKNTHLKDSIKEIAQVTIIDKVEKHLNETAKEFNAEIEKLSPELDRMSKDIQKVEENIEEEKSQLKNLKNEIEKAEERIFNIDMEISSVETCVSDNNKCKENDKKLDEIEEKLKNIKKELSVFVREYTILIYLYETNKKTDEYIRKKTEDDSINLNLNMDMIKSSLKTHKCGICGENLTSEREHYLENLLKKISSSNVIQKLSEIKNDITRGLNIVEYEKILDEYYKKIEDLEQEKENLLEENHILYERIRNVSNLDKVEDLIEEKKLCKKTLKLNTEKVGACKENIERMKNKLEKLNDEYEKAKQDEIECREIKEKYDFVKDSEKIISDVKKDIVNSIKSQMEIRTMEIFNSLSWKKETYERIELDENFKLKIYHKGTGLSCLNSCSAAEKELLALAFTIALHKVSGYNNLIFIDTPVGRVSDIHREKFSKVLLNVSEEKQIILAFTPSEFSDEIKSVLNDNVISTINRLKTDEERTDLQGV